MLQKWLWVSWSLQKGVLSIPDAGHHKQPFYLHVFVYENAVAYLQTQVRDMSRLHICAYQCIQFSPYINVEPGGRWQGMENVFISSQDEFVLFVPQYLFLCLFFEPYIALSRLLEIYICQDSIFTINDVKNSPGLEMFNIRFINIFFRMSSALRMYTNTNILIKPGFRFRIQDFKNLKLAGLWNSIRLWSHIQIFPLFYPIDFAN